MKTLTDYIHTSNTSLVNFINEAKTFSDYDKELENVKPDMKAAEQIKILSIKFSETGEAIDTSGIGDEELFYQTENWVKAIATTKQWAKYKELGKYVRDNELYLKGKIASWKQLFGIAASKFRSKDGCSRDALIGVLTGIAQYMREEAPASYFEEKGCKDVQKRYDKLLAQLTAKFEELVKTKYDQDFAIDSYYKINKDNIAKTIGDYNSVEDYKKSFKNHKYFVIGCAGGGNAEFRAYDTAKFESIYDCIDEFVDRYGYEITKAQCEQNIKMVATSGKIYSPSTSWATAYYFKNELDNKYKLPALGYIDDESLIGEGVLIHGYNSVDKLWMKRGKWTKVHVKDGMLEFFDSLWMDHSNIN